MENIYLDKQLDIQNIKESLTKIFPNLIVFHFDLSNDKPDKLDYENSNHIFFNTSFYEDKKEFGFIIEVYRTPEKDQVERQLLIGKAIAEQYEVRVLVPYTNPEDPGCPYYDIVFENGKTYLADDSNTSFADDSQGRVKILKEYPLPKFEFEANGQLMEK